MSYFAVRAFLRCAVVRAFFPDFPSLPPFSAVLFDLDGTLIDYETVSHLALRAPLARRRLLKEHDNLLPWAVHGAIVGMRNEDWSRGILSLLGVSPETYSPEQFVQDYELEVPGLVAHSVIWRCGFGFWDTGARQL